MKGLFDGVETVLVIDWPSKEVPELLALAGLNVVVHGGPGPEDYSGYEVKDNKVVSRHIGRPPNHAELVYSYRPLSELSQTIAAAKQVRAKTLWTQSGISPDGQKDQKGCWLSDEDLRSARNLVEAAGLVYVTDPYIGDVVRELMASRQQR
jgi:hypothetical protein